MTPYLVAGFGFGDGVLNSGLKHEYDVENVICNTRGAVNDKCNFENVYQGLLRYPAPLMPGGTPVYDGKYTQLAYFGRVIHSVTDNSVRNTTVAGKHWLDPGYVERTVVSRGNTISIHTYGYGTGPLPLTNTFFSDPLWSGIDSQVRNYVSGGYF